MEKPERITVAQAAALLGKSNLFVYEGLRRGVLPFGKAYKLPGSDKWNYIISPPALYEYIGAKTKVAEPSGPRGDLFTDEQIEVASSLFVAAMRAARQEVHAEEQQEATAGAVS